MATLRTYFSERAAPGAKSSIWAQFVFFIHVGSGSYGGFSDYEAQFNGQIDTIFFKGTLNLSLKLLDQNPEATSGPAEFTVNGARSTEASYSVEGSALVVKCRFSNGAEETARIERSADGRETYIGLSGAYGVNVHLAPV